MFQAPPGYRDSGRPIFANGEVINSAYQIRELLHSDNGGQVFEARDMLLDRLVALKATWRDEGVPPLIHEARALGAIDDVCVASVYGLGNHHQTEFLVAERIVGTALSKYTASVYAAGRTISARDAIEMLSILTRGLAAVHRGGYNVPYLNSKNVVRVSNSRLVLARFGFGQGQVEGEPPVLVPEVLKTGRVPRAGTAGAISMDLYALGCIAVELITGKPVFSGDTQKTIEFAHVQQRPPQLSNLRQDIPIELGDLVDELLAKQMELRPRSATDVWLQLRTISERSSAMRPPLRVLIVDDDPARVRSLWSLLRRSHASIVVDAARDADEAIQNAQQNRPNVLILNLALPGSMNGLELCMYLQGVDSIRNCVTIALSSSLKDSDARVLEQLGISHMLPDSRDAVGELTKIVRELAETASP